MRILLCIAAVPVGGAIGWYWMKLGLFLWRRL